MIEQAKNIIPQGERTDISQALQELINQNINNIKTAFLAKIISINGNRVSVQALARANDKEKNPIINNLPIAQPLSGEWKIQFDLKAGDIGLVIVCDSDISAFKYNNSSDFKATTNRKHDFNDGVYIPLSLNLQTAPQNINFTITDTAGENYITFTNGNLNIESKQDTNTKAQNTTIESEQITTLKAQLLTLQSANTTLKAELVKLANILKASTTETADSHSHSTFNGASQSALSSWASGLDSLFQN